MQSDTPVFLINLDKSADRLAFMTSQADAIGFAFERLKAVDGRAVPSWLEKDFDGVTNITVSQIGCYASHLVAAKTIVERKLPFAIVIEDDATLTTDFMDCAVKAAKTITGPWDYIHLSAKPKRSVVSVGRINDRFLVQFTYLPFNLAAYVLSNAGARKMLAPSLRTRPIDVDMWHAWERHLVIYGIYPAPAKQMNNFNTTIEQLNNDFGVLSIMTQAKSSIWTIRQIGLPAFFMSKLKDATASFGARFGWARQTPIVGSKSVSQ